MIELVDQKFHVRLAQAVEKYPVIYNTTIRGFHRKRCSRAREEAWKTIAGELECDVLKLKKKWKAFRSSLNLKERKNREGIHAQKYYLHDHIKYLIPYLNTKGKKKKNIEKEEEEEEEYEDRNESDLDLSDIEYEIVDEIDDADQDKMSFKDHDSSLGEEIITDEPVEKASNPRSSPKRSNNATNNGAVSTSKQSTPLSMAAQAASSSIGNAAFEESANSEIAKRHYLFSLLPDLQEMSNSQMRHFKCRVIGLIDEILKEN
ncbi:uncharacterized protein LOC101455979 isoform X2 [Ceratitis capitata]|uniref:Transcription factor Adf-1 n=1 Tax=Ceratitis capitata TaxID=7213 RepID=W8CCJ7_CERCA|nr:uncharacterized protein LOC101455979 isoform X2 [Ceratitis capitata]